MSEAVTSLHSTGRQPISSWVLDPPAQAAPQPCASCGACPTCGRGPTTVPYAYPAVWPPTITWQVPVYACDAPVYSDGINL